MYLITCFWLLAGGFSGLFAISFVVFFVCFVSGDKPGLGPAAEALSLQRPKKVTKERRAAVRGPSGFLALLVSRGKGANSAIASDSAPF
jgi:hypothetical protein